MVLTLSSGDDYVPPKPTKASVLLSAMKSAGRSLVMVAKRMGSKAMMSAIVPAGLATTKSGMFRAAAVWAVAVSLALPVRIYAQKQAPPGQPMTIQEAE